MYAPKRTKYRKQQKGRSGGVESNNSQIWFGKYAIKSLDHTRLKSSTIEAVRRAITRKLKRSLVGDGMSKRGGQLWIRTYPDLSVTSKPLEVRMGKGKGSLSYWASRIKVGQILYEIDGVSCALAKEAALLAASKLPLRTTFIKSD